VDLEPQKKKKKHKTKTNNEQKQLPAFYDNDNGPVDNHSPGNLFPDVVQNVINLDAHNLPMYGALRV
jgi:hypothetical protein